MSSIKMKQIDLISQMNQIDDILMTYVDLKGIHPVSASEIIEKVKGLTSIISEDPCRSILNEIEDLTEAFHFKVKEVECKDRSYDFNEMDDYVVFLKEKLHGLSKEIKELEENIQKYRDALIQIQNIYSLDIALEDLFACSFVFFRFGRIPNDSIEKIKMFLTKPFIFKTFSKDKHKTWCMYYTTNEYKREVDNIFSSLLFERVMIPDFVHGTPADAVEALESEIANIQKMVDAYQKEMDTLISANLEKLSNLKGELIFLERVYEARKYVVGMGSKFSIISLIKETAIADFMKAFEKFETTEIEVKDAYSDQRIQLPKHIKDNWFKF